MSKKQIKDIWGWLNEITLYKTPIDKISESSWEYWNSYMIHRFVSMNFDYVELSNYVQTIPYEKKKQTYLMYREFIPKKKVYLKYIKSKNKKKNPELLKKLSEYFICGLQESETFIDILSKKEIKDILLKMGVDDKESKKLLKS
jgi:hypothetical protein